MVCMNQLIFERSPGSLRHHIQFIPNSDPSSFLADKGKDKDKDFETLRAIK